MDTKMGSKPITRYLALLTLLVGLVGTPARADVIFDFFTDMPKTQVDMQSFVDDPTNLVNGVWSYRFTVGGTDLPMDEVVIASGLPFMSNDQNHNFFCLSAFLMGNLSCILTTARTR